MVGFIALMHVAAFVTTRMREAVASDFRAPGRGIASSDLDVRVITLT